MAKRCADLRSSSVNASQGSKRIISNFCHFDWLTMYYLIGCCDSDTFIYSELIALGSCNMLTSWFTGFVSAGSFSRSAVAESVGAQTPLYSLFGSLTIMASVLWFLPSLKYLPKCCLSAIVVVSVINLFDITAMKRLWIIKKKDFVVMLITLICTIILDIEMGIVIGIIVSMLMYIQNAASPSLVRLGRISENDVFRSVFVPMESDPKTREISNMLILRWDENLFFGNIEVFKSMINKEIMLFLERNRNQERMWYLVLCCAAINDVDASAAEYLRLYLDGLDKKHGERMIIGWTDLKSNVRQVLIRSGILCEPALLADTLDDETSLQHTFLTVQQAVNQWTNNPTERLSEP